jgi:hypothetical protein
MSLRRGPKSIVTEGLLFYVDAANPKSYISGSTNVENLLPLNNNIIGSLKNGVDFSTNAWEFDGTDDRMAIDELVPLMDSYAESTYNVWVKPKVVSQRRYVWCFTPNISFYPVLGLAYTSPEGGGSFSFSGSYDVLTAASSTNRTILATTGSIFPREWTNVCVTKQSGGNTENKYNIKIYVNGVDQNTTLTDDRSTSDWWNNNLTAGSGLTEFNLAVLYRPAASTQYTNCNISSFSIYNRTLTSAEVLQNYNALKGRFGL